ncbi:MAG: DNA polymerase III subunit gamma/tau [Deltaproteobacteria bacterium]|nr:DNA polymerase III subunit gamma/tau [Deltaproteobacteria bacterium]
MSYLVLARKSRPQTFDQVVGQRSIVKTLQNSLALDRVAHAILFSGVRGVGKTTLARIMAKAINCQATDVDRPCGSCPSCLEIAAGSALDLYEIDGASNRGIQEIRELKEKLRFLPTSCKYKVIIIDEVHMLTTEAFNALLKTLEEPPAHVYFMFATTEIHKIPITILSRCQQYELKRIPAGELYDHFQKLTSAEDFEIEPAALSLIVREAGGSVRDGLSLLDQMFSFGEKTIRTQDVIEVLGLVDRDVLMQLTKGLLDRNYSNVLQPLEDIFNYGMDIKRFLIDLMGYFRSLLLCKIDGCTNLIDLPSEDLAEFQKLAQNYSAETLHQKLNLLMAVAEEIRFSSQPRLSLETSFLKIIEADNVLNVSVLLGKLDKIIQEQPSAKPSRPAATEEIRTAPVTKKEPGPPEPQEKPGIQERPEPAAKPVKEISETVPPRKKISAPPTPPPHQEQEQAEKQITADIPAKKEKLQLVEKDDHKKNVRKDWPDFISYVKDRKLWMAQNLQRADKIKQENGELHLTYNDPANCSVLRQKENHQLLTEFSLDFFQQPIKIRFILPDEADPENGSLTESPQRKRQELANDPLVLMTTEVFNGQVGDIRVGPRSR